MLTLAETAAAHGVHPHTIKAWRRAGIVSAQRYNDKGEYLYYPPDPANPPNRPKIGRRPKHSDQPEPQLLTNRPEEVQYAARGLSVGV